MARDLGIDELGTMDLEPRQGAGLVLAHKAAEANHIRTEDGG